MDTSNELPESDVPDEFIIDAVIGDAAADLSSDNLGAEVVGAEVVGAEAISAEAIDNEAIDDEAVGDEANAVTLVTSDEVNESTADVSGGGKKSRSDRRKSDKSSGRTESGPMEKALRRFQACGRCSYFVADCQIYLGRDTVRAAIEEGPKEWLMLEWADVLRRLTRESYIANDDVFYFYYDGTCPECQRRYTYLTEPHEDEQPMFRLQY